MTWVDGLPRRRISQRIVEIDKFVQSLMFGTTKDIHHKICVLKTYVDDGSIAQIFAQFAKRRRKNHRDAMRFGSCWNWQWMRLIRTWVRESPLNTRKCLLCNFNGTWIASRARKLSESINRKSV